MPSYDVTRQAAETRAARAATRLRRVALREDERLAESVDDARHTAMVGAGRPDGTYRDARGAVPLGPDDPTPEAAIARAHTGHGPRPLTDAERDELAAESLDRLRLTPGALDIDYATVCAALDELAALRARVARLEAEAAQAEDIMGELEETSATLTAERDDERRQRVLYEADIRDLAADIDRLTAARDAARAALVEETARRLWAEAYLDALAACGHVEAGARWEDMAREHDRWRDRAHRAVARARAATGGGDAPRDA